MVHRQVFRNVMISQRNIELSCPYIVINENISPKLYEFLAALEEVKFQDGLYHTYYGEIKSLVNNFLLYWSDIINACLQDIDDLCNGRITKQEILELIDRSIEVHEDKHAEFVKAYFPVDNEEELKIFENLEIKYEVFQKNMANFREEVDEFERQEQMDQFINKYSELGTRKKNEVFDCTHTIMSFCMSEQMYKIRASMEEIKNRIQHNLRKLMDDRDTALSTLLDDLYDKNKEKIVLTRQEHRKMADEGEVDFAIKKIREKIEDHQVVGKSFHHLDEELKYWDKRISEFEKIEDTILKLKEELKNTEDFEKAFKDMCAPEHRGTRRDCWLAMPDNIEKRKTLINEKMVEAVKALVTFFAIRGQNRIFYEDDIGKYIMDDYGHQIYFFDHGNHQYHVNCDGKFRKVKENTEYYFDDYGRYIIGNGNEKVYQCAPCTSTYNLAETDLLVKTTVDCGHSEKINPHCKMQLKDPNDIEILPTVEPVDIRKTLTTKVVKYLWDSFGPLLPAALFDTGMRNSKNPIHFLSHSILKNRYLKSDEQIAQKEIEAQDFSQKIFGHRKEIAIKKARAWKAKQVQPRKPEEFDDSESRAVYDAYIAQQRFNTTINDD